jgi:hypothetical protein
MASVRFCMRTWIPSDDWFRWPADSKSGRDVVQFHSWAMIIKIVADGVPILATLLSESAVMVPNAGAMVQ